MNLFNLSRRQFMPATLLAMANVIEVSGMTNTEGRKNFFFLNEKFTEESFLMMKPVLDDYAEAHIVYDLKKLRTAEIVAELTQQDTGFIDGFLYILNLDEKEKNRISHSLLMALSDVSDIVLYFKKKYNRPRPSEILPSIDPILKVPSHKSYPSGHAAQAMAAARLLSAWTTGLDKDLYKLAKKVGRNREIAGLHYPSDTNAGFILGEKIAQLILKENNVQL
jgi:hypothetical protein